jgi:peroxiredoxin
MHKLKKRFLIPTLLTVGFVTASILIYLDRTGPYYLPKLTLETIENEKINLASLKGNPVLITFWASTCIECIPEIPDLISLHHDYYPQGLRIIGIIIYYNEISQAIEMTHSKELPYTIARDQEKSATYAFGNVHLTPTTFLASPSGRIVYRHRGQMDIEKVRRIIDQLLNDR